MTDRALLEQIFRHAVAAAQPSLAVRLNLPERRKPPAEAALR